MTFPHRTITTRVEDEYGAVFDRAEVTIYDAATAPEISISANLKTGNYDVGQSNAPIAYSAMYHVSEATRRAGKRTRPLMQEVDIVDENDVVIETRFEDKFIVNEDEPTVVAARQGVADPVEMILRVISADIKSRFA